MLPSDPNATSISLAKLQNPVKQSFEALKMDLKEVHAELGNYSKALEKAGLDIQLLVAELTDVSQRFKDKSLPLSDHNAPPLHPSLINRAIGMHFLREGQFSVASMFLTEASSKLPEEAPVLLSRVHGSILQPDTAVDVLRSEGLRKQFAEMYHILDEMRSKRNLLPATKWAKVNSSSLQVRGSNLEFELVRLQFIWLFTGGSTESDASRMLECQQAALQYAREEFGGFQGRYLREIQQLIGAVVFYSNLRNSPYKRIFHHSGAWEDLALSFTREFCAFLGLSADSPLYVASTAGAIALPTLQKLQKIKELKRTEWTTQQELPVSSSDSPRQSSAESPLGRGCSTSILSLSLYLRMPSFQGADYRPQSADDDAMRTCDSARITSEVEQGE